MHGGARAPDLCLTDFAVNLYLACYWLGVGTRLGAEASRDEDVGEENLFLLIWALSS